MSEVSTNNKRIAKNTLALYARMLLVMLVSLYTVRVVLQVLGEEDYGIYNVVGGIVAMFAFLSSTLASSSNRYFAYSIGQGDYDRLEKVFSVTTTLYLIGTVVIAILAESIGFWYLHTQLNIPGDRMNAAEWVLHCSVLTFAVTLVATPHKAMIIAHEKMGFYAYVGVLEAVLALALAFSLKWIGRWDHLIVYAILMLLCGVVVNMSYIVFARQRCKGARYHFYWDGGLMKEIASFSGWNLFGALAAVIKNHGINLLLGAFFLPSVNAARGIAYRVSGALNSFSNNFYMAVRPQITKYYAQDNRAETFNLVVRSARMTYFLMFFLSIPVACFASPILSLWLKGNVPTYTSEFMVMAIVIALIDAMSHPLITLAQATGRVALYQSVVGMVLIMTLPISWIFLKYGGEPVVTVYVALAISIIAMSLRLLILRRIADFPVRSFLSLVFRSIVWPSVISMAFLLVFRHFVYDLYPSVVMLIVSVSISIIFTTAMILFLGLDNSERRYIYSFVQSKFSKK